VLADVRTLAKSRLRRHHAPARGFGVKLKSFTFVALAALAAAAPARAGEEILFAPPAAWVAAREPAPETIAEPDLPVAVLSFDTQVRDEGGRQDIYSASKLKFLTAQGLAAGNLAFAWRPETDDLTVHKVLIHREDETIDLLGEGQTFAVLRREQNLEQAMLDGTLTANLFPDGLQVGDVLEVATTITTRNPVTGDHAEALVGPLNLAAGRADVTLSWPTGTKMRLERTDDLPQWKRTRRGGYEFAELSLVDLRPIVPPRGAPGRYALVRMAQASDYASWGEVSQLFAPLYAEAAAIPAEGALRNEVEKIRAASEDPVVRAEKALALVQERVRYVALLSGLGGLVPASAADTWTRRYGDCKGKTALLMGILAELGIESEPVLVSTVLGKALDERLPGVGLFDHVILRATIDGREYWLDGTRTGDSALARLEVPYFGWGLPVREGAAELVRLIPEPPAQPLEDFAIEFDAREGIYGDVPARLEIVYSGDSAIGLNAALSQMTGDVRDRALREFWRDRLDFVEADQVRSVFDPVTGELRLTLEGTAKMDWDGGWYTTDYTRVGYRADFSRDAGHGRDAPFRVGYPSYDRTRQTILLPPGFAETALRGETEVDEVVGGVHYYRHATLEDGRFHIERSERSVVPEFPAAEAAAAEKRLRELSDKRVQLRVPGNYNPTESDMAAATSGDGDAEALVTLGNNLLDQRKYAEALEVLVKATEADPTNQYAWSNKGLAEVWLNKLAEASVSLDWAAAAGPMNAHIHGTRGFVAERRRDFKGAVREYTAALELNADDNFSRGHRAQAYMGLDNVAAALADAEAALANDPSWLDLFSLKAYVAAVQGGSEEAIEVVDQMLAANPDNEHARNMARSMYRQYGAAERAEALGAEVQDGPETAYLWFQRAAAREQEDTEGRLSDLDQALALDSGYAPALHFRAVLRQGKSDYDGALADIDRAVEANRYDPQLYLLKANILKSAGRADEALAVASELAAVLPDDVFAQVAAAKIYDAFDEKEQALASIDRALRINPEAYIYLNRAELLPYDDLDGRLAEIEKALVLDPRHGAALTSKADLLARSGRYAEAEQVYHHIIENLPDLADSARGDRGILLWRLGREDEARAEFAAARASVKGSGPLNNLCYTKAVADVALDLALDECEEALRLQPDSAAIMDSHATVLLRLGRYEEAADAFDRALEKSPTMAPSLLGRALARAALGQIEAARADLALAEEGSSRIVERFAAMGLELPAALAQGR
jgi:tetratricopeptide (TPR) repeat protein